jgi:D-alanine-D-alanine ligase
MPAEQCKLRIFLLMGGMSSEHDVSLMSGRKALAALDPARFDVTPVTIGRDGRWAFPDGAALPIFDAVPRLAGADCVFLALHGEYGEDGRLQGLLDLLDLPYTSSGCAASALAMDKVRSKAVVSAQGIRVAGHVALNRPTWAVSVDDVVSTVSDNLGYPCVVKPAALGSSVGMAIPENEQALREALNAAFAHAEDVMIEEFVTGTEVTCAVLEAEPGGLIRPLPVTEIRPKEGAYFDYHCKYTAGATEEITPAEISPELTEAVQEMAAHVHQILGLGIWSRSDFIIDGEGPVWLEVNTIPGLTETSLFPQAAAAAGIGYGELLGMFIDAAVLRHRRERRQG